MKTRYKGIQIRDDNGIVFVRTTYKNISIYRQFSGTKAKAIKDAHKWLNEQKRKIDILPFYTDFSKKRKWGETV
jgi:hypothetical protein